MQPDDLGPRLRARSLLRHHELTALEIPPRLRQQNRGLHWEKKFSVNILVQAVVITGTAAQEQGSRQCLSRGATLRQVLRVLLRVSLLNAQQLVPVVRGRNE